MSSEQGAEVPLFLFGEWHYLKFGDVEHIIEGALRIVATYWNAEAMSDPIYMLIDDIKNTNLSPIVVSLIEQESE